MKIGIDLGGSHLGLGIINQDNKIIEQYERDFSDTDKKDIKPVIEMYIINKVTELKKKYEIESIGIAIPGPSKDGIIIKAVNLGIENYNMAKVLGEQLHIPVTVKNDARCAFLAEYNCIKEENPNIVNFNILFLTIGTGIGGGFIYNGELLEGNNFDGCEFGHMVIKENGVPCNCGKSGCFERYGSILEYKNKIRQKLNIPKSVNSSPLRKIMKENLDEIKDINKQYVQDLAIGISNLINIFEPDIIILGGGFSHFSEFFEKDLKAELTNSNLLFNKRKKIDLRIAELGNDAGMIGAVL